ncbi:hypothetical protein GS682_32430 [Nostoc sp. B(2019)]|nr:hypothetical protein [Nostoc sp. B(2019)]
MTLVPLYETLRERYRFANDTPSIVRTTLFLNKRFASTSQLPPDIAPKQPKSDAPISPVCGAILSSHRLSWLTQSS